MNLLKLVGPLLQWRFRWLCGALCLVGGANATVALGQTQDSLAAMAGAPFTLRSETYPGTGTPRLHSQGSIQYTDITGWLTPRQASSLGLTLGIVSGNAGSTPMAYDLGVRWRSQLNARVQLNVHAWARTPQHWAIRDAQGMIWDKEQNAFYTRLEVQWATSRTHGLVPEFGAVGLQLEGNSRLLLRARRGGPMSYYRTKF